MNEREKNFKAAMAKKKLNPNSLSIEMGVTRQAVYSFMRSLKNGNPQVATAQKYAEALNVPVEKIL